MSSKALIAALSVHGVASDCSTLASKKLVGEMTHSECGNLKEFDCCARCSGDCVASQVNTSGCCVYFSTFSGTIDDAETTAVFTGDVPPVPNPSPAPMPTPPPMPIPTPIPTPTPRPTPTPMPSPGGHDPNWGCGFVGVLPGISQDGSTSSEMQRMIDGVKGASSFNKVNYWNWNLAPQADDGVMEYLSEDFIFMPEQWGAGVVHDSDLQPAGQVGIKDMEGGENKATMATILMGANEPDQTGSCMGNMMGQCTRACTDDEVDAGACPVAHIKGDPAEPNPIGHCDCWSDSHATGSGFWSVKGCYDPQPLPNLWDDKICTREVMNAWKVTAAIAVKKGYKFLSTPLVASNMDWLHSFVKTACDGCSDISCGCPTHIGWHFYANDCRPQELGGYDGFQDKLDKSKAIMEEFPNIKGAIVNEIGMLNCVMDAPDFACVPNGPNQKYPANQQSGNTCPSTEELPNGMGSFIEKLMDMAAKAKTSDGRRVVKSIAWFNENQSGGTYDLRLFDNDGTINSVGESYIKGCQAWASSITADSVVV